MSSADSKSKLVEAILSGDDNRISEEWSKLEPVLYNFLICRMNASQEDAEDCVHQSLLTVIEKVQDYAISNPDQIKSYLIQCCKHNYFRIIERKKKEFTSEEIKPPEVVPEQVENLVHKQNQTLLNKCLEALSDFNKNLIATIFYNPSKNLTELANEYNMTSNALWTRKHRIIQKLAACIKKIENDV